jgi:hypothetical protein
MKIHNESQAANFAYSDESIHITNPDFPNNITVIAAEEGEDSIILQWELIDDPSIKYYYILLSKAEDFRDMKFHTAVLPDCNTARVEGLEPGVPYVVSVVAVDENNNQSEAVALLQVVAHRKIGYTHPVIVSDPETNANSGYLYAYQPLVFDSDYHHHYSQISDDDATTYQWTLLSGPEGMEIFEGGTLLWIPTEEQVGEHTVKIQLTDQKAAEFSEIAETAIQEFVVTVFPKQNIVVSYEELFMFLLYPTTSAVEATTYSYQSFVNALPESIDWILLDGPEGMTVDSTGLVTWDVPKGSPGQVVRLMAVIEGLFFIEQEYYLHVITESNTLILSEIEEWNKLK